MEKLLDLIKISGDDLKKVSVITLILSNIVPVLGVIFMGWQAFAVLFLFWFENIVIGISNVFKMAAVSSNNIRIGARSLQYLFLLCITAYSRWSTVFSFL